VRNKEMLRSYCRGLCRGLSTQQFFRSSFLSYIRILLLTALLFSLAPKASAQSAAGELVQYPSEEVAFLCGPQLRSGSTLNPYPWFDRTAIEYGHRLGAEVPAVAPRILTGTITMRMGSATVDGVGTRFTLEVDPNGPAPLYNGWFRVKMADGTYREAKVASVSSDTRLTLTAPWSGTTASGMKADTYHYEPTRWQWNYDRYYDTAYYDMALVQYLNYYRTGDPAFLTYARRAADSWWASPYIDYGTVVSGPDNLPPRSMAYTGLMLRALDGRPEMWDYLERQSRATFDNWVGRRLSDPTLYYDIREDGYAQLYAVLLARVLPDTYPLQGAGTLAQPTGTMTEGASKREGFLRDASSAAVNFFGRLQRADGSWRWDVEGMGLVRIEQPFMIGIYLESVVALDRVTSDPRVKASLRTQLERSVRHLYTQAYRGGETVTDMQQYRWRGMWYFWGGGTTQDPTAYERGVGYGEMVSGGDAGMIRQVRHLNSTVHHAFGYAYAVTGNEEYLRMGEEVFDASYGERVDGIHAQADTGRGKDYAMNFRASARYLVWRLAGAQTRGAEGPQAVARPATNEEPAAAIAASLSLAQGLSKSSEQSEGQVASLRSRIEAARQAFADARGMYDSPEGVLSELDAALQHVRTALDALKAGDGETAKRREEWAAARLKRAADHVRRR
jgi:hypothetical protein